MARRATELVELVREYYARAELELPDDMALREFAIQPMESESYVRHLSFRTPSELKSFLLKNVPRHLYFSSARYRDPSCNDMQGKGWLGSDLIFDIDADHLPQCANSVIECKVCPRCGEVFESTAKVCSRCGNGNLLEIDYVPMNCIDAAKDEMIKLVEAIESELGYKDFHIAFSGHRGFHARVVLRGEDALMPSEARREIVSYLKLEGVDPSKFMIVERRYRGKKMVTLPPRVRDPGVRGRVGRALLKLVDDSEARSIVEGKVLNFKVIASKASNLNALLFDALRAASIIVDEKVTMDVSRLVRVPGSINGKAGWLCRSIPLNKLPEFQVCENTVSPIPGHVIEVRLLVNIPRMDFEGKVVHGKKGDVLVLESYIALYLAFKGVAKLVRIKR